ncbi:hypothetical protein GGS20DRAFT_271240 [Poronia punctata]|nr:hypothetical protein GGS20DRAFT_271240 [Poronia punctata]
MYSSTQYFGNGNASDDPTDACSLSSYTATASSDAGDTIFSGYSMASASTAVSHPDAVDEPNPDLLAVAASGGLPCEFVGYTGCDMTFSLVDVDGWIEHIITDHLRNILPRKVFCWFCDSYIFDAMTCDLDYRQNFDNRMWHIRDHFMDYSGSVEGMRVDHHLNEHLNTYNLVEKSVYHRVRKMAEVPLPRGLLPLNTLPHELEKKEERKKRVYHDLQDEKRRMRKQQQQRKVR